MNRIVIMGRLTKNPEYKLIGQEEIPRTSFTVAVDRRGHDRNGNQVTDFIPCTAWRGTAEFIAKYFTKGMRILLEGELHVDSYQAQDGSNRTWTNISVTNAEFCERKQDSAQSAPPPQEEWQEAEDDDDLPFE